MSKPPIPWETLIKFCEADWRPHLMKPFTILDGYTVATDGRRLVAVEYEYPQTDSNHRSTLTKEFLKSVCNLIKGSIIHPLSAMQETELFTIDPGCIERVVNRCPICNKDGKVPKLMDCPQCEGIGEVECECCGSDTGCKECSGSGSVPVTPKVWVTCNTCDGSKEVCEFLTESMRVPDQEVGAPVKSYLLYDILHLPSPRFAYVGHGEPIVFSGKGYIGAIMPVREY